MARAAIANLQAAAAQKNANATNAANAANSGALDTADVATLNDALGSAGVDLRAEEESLQRSQDQPQPFRVFEDRSRKQPARPNFDVAFLASTMRTVAAQHKVSAIPDDCVNYLALALRARLQDLVTGMIDVARHRTNTQFDRPASLYEDGSATWGILVRSDVAKQLAALEKVEREEETRLRQAREKREQVITAALTAALAGEDQPVEIPADDDDDMDGGARKRRKKAAVSEETGRKMANAAASRAAGLTGKYAWLTTSHAGRPQAAGAASAAGATPPPPPPREGSGWARPYKPTKREPSPPPLPPDADQRMPITIRDAMFVIEKERGHGGGRGAARGWT
ncbi:transcription initiation factor TFIID component TAF4 [Mycena epipterygia]|nr:transcription initiation factor TFIID component TAF4 [Mycena epipterygia]